MFRTRLIALMLSSCFIAGCSDAKKAADEAAVAAKKAAEDAKVAAAKAAENAKKVFGEAKATLAKEFGDQIGGFDKKLEELKLKAKDASADAKPKLEEKAKDAEGLMKQAKDHIAKIGDVSQDGWEEFKKKLQDLIEQIKKKFE